MAATYGFFQSYKDGCLILQGETIVAANRSLHKMLGYDNLVGRNVDAIFISGNFLPQNDSMDKTQQIDVSGVVKALTKSEEEISLDVYHSYKYKVGNTVFYASIMREINAK